MYFKGFSVVRSSNTQETAELIWSICTKIEKEFSKGKPEPKYAYPSPAPASESPEPTPETAVSSEEAVSVAGPSSVSYSNFVKKAKHENITPENIGEIILCQIPGISSTSAAELMRQYGGSIYALLEDINERPEKLETIYFSTAGGKKRKIGTNIVQNLQKYLSRGVGEPTVQGREATEESRHPKGALTPYDPLP
jgi:ERCC4-type nuclease